MRKILLLMALVISTTATAIAQQKADSVITIYKQKTKAYKTEQIGSAERSALAKPNQIRVGVGAVGPVSPTFSVEYSRKVNKILEVGGSLSYGKRSKYETFNGMDYYTDFYASPSRLSLVWYDYSFDRFVDSYTIGVSVYGRVSWFRRKFVSMYSSVGLNAIYINSVEREVSLKYGEEVTYSRGFQSPTKVMLDIVPFGLRIGRDIFGYFEPFSYSNRGYCMIFGAGFRF